MELEPSALDLARPPAALEELVDWFEALSYGLVLLEPYPLTEVRGAVDRFHQEVRLHSDRAESHLAHGPLRTDPLGRTLTELVRADHRWFETSFDQLDWFLRIAEEDGHGGNRQALGQYGRLVADAVRRHLADERLLASMSSASTKD
ncbi:MAG TPA: hypothetical protein VMV28_07390 [Thermoplasmata archaeon]|nr:hypothetical protein [Thermoplasmata archaeon]